MASSPQTAKISTSLFQSIKKAQEETGYSETFEFLGLKITLKSLTKVQMDLVAEEMLPFTRTDEEGIANVHYLREYCNRCLVKSIVALNDQSFEGVVVVETPEGVKMETPLFLRSQFLDHLSMDDSDALWSLFDKVTEKSKEKAKGKVSFSTPDERPDEALDRLLREAAKHTKDLPQDLTYRLLNKHGFSTVTPLGAVVEGEEEEAPSVHAEPVVQVQPSASQEKESQETPLPRAPVDLDPTIPLAPSQSVSLDALRDQELAILQRGQKEATVPVDQPPTPGINPRFRPRA